MSELHPRIAVANASPWTHPSTGEIRYYVNGWPELIGLDVGYYKTGNICGASLKDERISNAEAGRILGAKVWLTEDGAVWARGSSGRKLDDADIADQVGAALDAKALLSGPASS